MRVMGGMMGRAGVMGDGVRWVGLGQVGWSMVGWGRWEMLRNYELNLPLTT